MCGIVGFSGPETRQRENILRKVTSLLSRRGPDNEGYWFSPDGDLAFGFRRLSILDLSESGRQPMQSRHGLFTIVFNGEVYNSRELRSELEPLGHTFRGHSDTETMLASFEEWGVNEAVKKFVGMFALAVYDAKAQGIYLVRDRLGEKPLYYGWSNTTFLFASELKPFRAHPYFECLINRDALALFLRLGYIPSPYSIYEGVWKLEPGCILFLPQSELGRCPSSFSPFARGGNSGGDRAGEASRFRPQAFWSLDKIVERGLSQPFLGNEQEALEQFERLLRDAVKLQMIADVPLGAFLSGGIDSSTIVSIMQSESSVPISTFTIGFHEKSYNEAEYARAVAKHLGTKHHELYVSSDEARDVIPLLPKLYDEPFGDASQIPTYLISKLARKSVVVSLSGDGGDELFAGYSRYLWAKRLWSLASNFPLSIRKGVGAVISAAPTSFGETVFQQLKRFAPQTLSFHNAGTKLKRFGFALGAKNSSDYYSKLVSHWTNACDVTLGSQELSTVFSVLPLAEQTRFLPKELVSLMMFFDMAMCLPDDLLTKVDRASMGVSLEVRVPLLDHRIVEFAWSLPLSQKLQGGTQKWLLRKTLAKFLPDELINRPKKGFSVPIGAWLRAELKDWVEDLLDEQALREQNFFNVGLVRKKWEQHLNGTANYEYELWDVLMFQAWLSEQTTKE